MLVTAKTSKHLKIRVSLFQRASCKVSASTSLGGPSRLHPRGHRSFRGGGGGQGSRVLVYPGEHPSAVEERGAGVGWRNRILETQTRRQGIGQDSLDAFLFSEKGCPFSEKKRVGREEGAPPPKGPSQDRVQVFLFVGSRLSLKSQRLSFSAWRSLAGSGPFGLWTGSLLPDCQCRSCRPEKELGVSSCANSPLTPSF